MNRKPTPRPAQLSAPEPSEAINAALTTLKGRVKAGDVNAANQLARLRFDLHCDYLELFERDSTKNPSIGHLLRMADLSISRLMALAETQPQKLRVHAEERHYWPGYVALTADMEARFMHVAKSIGLGEKLPCSINRKTKSGVMLNIAIGAVRYLSRSTDSFTGFYFAPFIQGVDRMERPAIDRAVNTYRKSLGPLIRSNWQKWKPVFENYITLRYGPTKQRWERIPAQWRNNCWTAMRFGVIREWVAANKMEHLKSEFEAIESKGGRGVVRPIMDWGGKEIGKIWERAQGRDSKWGDFQDELLKKCERVLKSG